VAVGEESVVNGLDVGGMEPDRSADTGLSDGCQISARNSGLYLTGRRAAKAFGTAAPGGAVLDKSAAWAAGTVPGRI
jgi:hypothetical protein